MPELPDIVVYLDALRPRVAGRVLEGTRVRSPFVVRTVDPPLTTLAGRTVTGLRRLGKRVVLVLDRDLFLVIHLMIAGRLHWRPTGTALHGRRGLAAFDFANGSLQLTEAATTQRAAIHLVRGEDALSTLDRGGLDVFTADAPAFRAALRRENHTLKRALTDPRILSGIGNAYSDEILHAARLSPFALTAGLDDATLDRLFHAARTTLESWIARLRRDVGDGFPENVTAFRDGMAVHGRYRRPCPVCGAPIQRIRYATNEANYCARCQTAGRVLADRSLSRLLKDDWPRSLDEWESRLPGSPEAGPTAHRRSPGRRGRRSP